MNSPVLKRTYVL